MAKQMRFGQNQIQKKIHFYCKTDGGVDHIKRITII